MVDGAPVGFSQIIATLYLWNWDVKAWLQEADFFVCFTMKEWFVTHLWLTPPPPSPPPAPEKESSYLDRPALCFVLDSRPARCPGNGEAA